jgi:hypothetical protein
MDVAAGAPLGGHSADPESRRDAAFRSEVSAIAEEIGKICGLNAILREHRLRG